MSTNTHFATSIVIICVCLFFIGYAYTEAECKAKSVSIVEDNEGIYTAQLMAHEIGHRYTANIFISMTLSHPLFTHNV